MAVTALLALALPGSAGSSTDECTQTLSNAGTAIGSSGRDVICGTAGIDRLEGRAGNGRKTTVETVRLRARP